MDDNNPSHWRELFEPKRRERAPGSGANGNAAPHSTPPARPGFGYDDGYAPTERDAAGNPARAPLSPEDITDEAAMALALDAREYQPWVLQRGRSRPPLLLHLRRFEPKSGLWQGWQVSYPHLIAVDYTGDKLLSLDFGTRQFIIEGTGLMELARHLQLGNVLMVQEFAMEIWTNRSGSSTVDSIVQAR